MATTANDRRTGRRTERRVDDGAAGFTITLFFVFMLIDFAIYSLMFCTVVTTLIGMGLLSLALMLTISGYLAGA